MSRRLLAGGGDWIGWRSRHSVGPLARVEPQVRFQVVWQRERSVATCAARGPSTNARPDVRRWQRNLRCPAAACTVPRAHKGPLAGVQPAMAVEHVRTGQPLPAVVALERFGLVDALVDLEIVGVAKGRTTPSKLADELATDRRHSPRRSARRARFADRGCRCSRRRAPHASTEGAGPGLWNPDGDVHLADGRGDHHRLPQPPTRRRLGGRGSRSCDRGRCRRRGHLRGVGLGFGRQGRTRGGADAGCVAASRPSASVGRCLGRRGVMREPLWSCSRSPAGSR